MPGEQAQVDWGYLGEIYDIKERKLVKLYCFFMILGYSRMLYAEVFTNMRFEQFLKGHNNAFKYFGGYPREILYDNLKSVVIKRSFLTKDSEFNKRFMDFAGYYGFKPILCRPYKPTTKGKIENSVKYVKQNFYIGNEFSSVMELNSELKTWLESANNRFHKTILEKPINRLSKESLNSIKQEYNLIPHSYRKVYKDCFFSYSGNYYSVPYQYAGKEVLIKDLTTDIEIIYRDKLIAKHSIMNGKGNYVRDKSHFEGLLELKCTHKPPKLINKKKPEKPIYIEPISHNYTNVQTRDLSYYEGVL